MRVGVTFPQTELGGDPGAVRAYGQRVEELGFTHLLVYDHVVGADPTVHRDWNGPYDVHTTFHEPFVMFGYLAAVTQSLELVTGVIILPQRQTALVAKQAAEVDLLSGGRLRLGIGVGWNAVEYEALGEDFSNRGKRSAEQISAAASALDRAVGDVSTATSTSDRGGYRTTARAAPDSGVDRGGIGAGLRARRAPGRRMVPDDGAGTPSSTRHAPSSNARRSRRAVIPPASGWRAEWTGAVTARRRPTSSRRGPRRAPLMSRSTPWAPG